MKSATIWLFWERPGVWGLRVGDEWHEAKTVRVEGVALVGRHREPQPHDVLEYPRGYMEGFGYVYREGSHAVICDEDTYRRLSGDDASGASCGLANT